MGGKNLTLQKQQQQVQQIPQLAQQPQEVAQQPQEVAQQPQQDAQETVQPNNTAPQQVASVQQPQQSLPIRHILSNINLQSRNNPTQMNYLIKPFTSDNNRQSQRTVQSNLNQAQLQQILSMFKDNSRQVAAPEEMNDSIRMLVLLENGEQRLITFTLPKDACTLREILEEIDVPFTSKTDIQVTELNVFNLNYVVTVGNVCKHYPSSN